MSEKSVTWLERWHHFLKLKNERRLVVVTGESKTQSDAVQAISHFCQHQGKSMLLWGSAIADLKSINLNFRHQLGREYDVVVFNDEQFHADAFAALSGTIKAGGFLVWLPSETQQKSPDLFIQRLNRQVSADAEVLYFAKKLPDSESHELNFPTENTSSTLDFNARTQDQLAAINAILKVAQGRAHRPLVLTADRGRGKSTALGIAAGHLIKHSTEPFKIAVCAPVRESVAVFFNSAINECTDSELKNNTLSFGDNSVEFFPIDKLLHEQPDVNLLLVDEAAAIPLYLLNRLVQSYPRIVFSTTQHGYEGAGRGFATKFRKTLEKLTPNYRKLHLEQAIRWREGDPLERFTFSAFVLNASEREGRLPKGQFHVHLLNKNELSEDEGLLEQVFAILVSSHYQTSPSDLKLILTNPQAKVFVVKQEMAILAVSLVIEEGLANDSEISLVQQHKRQLKNQFIPQYLYRHCAVERAFEYKFWRVSRIAVCQNMQSQGIGSYLLNQIEDKAKQHGVDFLATSFAASALVVSFWHKAGFVMTDLGLNKDKASGEYSAVLLKAISNNHSELLDSLHFQAVRSFWYKLSTTHSDIEPELAFELVCGFSERFLPALELIDETNVARLLSGQAQLAQSAFSIQLWLKHQMKNAQTLSAQTIKTEFGLYQLPQAFYLLLRKYWLCHSDASLIQEAKLTGVKQLNSLLLATLQALDSKNT